MGILNVLFGYRWSLYVVKNGNEYLYSMSNDSPYKILGYIMSSFRNGRQPVSPWSLKLTYNKNKESILLNSKHFTVDGENCSTVLIKELERIDNNMISSNEEPVVLNLVTKKPMKITSYDFKNVKKMLENAYNNVEKEHDFFDVIKEVFGGER